jgi:parvulin-like peptidyl-prolyl isomerase
MRNSSVVVLLAAIALPAMAEEVDRIVLRVNDRIATLQEYHQRRAARIDSIAAADELTAEQKRTLIAEAGQATMREIFDELLVLSRAQQLRLTVAPGQIDAAVDVARRRFGIPTDADFAEALEQSGSSVAAFRARMERQILFNDVVQQEIAPRVQIDDEEVARYWRDHPQEFAIPEARRIEEAVVLDSSPRSPADRRALAAQIRDAVVAGESVVEAVERLGATDDALAVEHGWIEKGDLEVSLDTAAWELDSGGVAGPIDGRGGLHVLHLIEIREASVQAHEEVREQILGQMREEQFGIESREWLASLARSAYIVESLPEDAAGYRASSAGDSDPVRALLRGPQLPTTEEGSHEVREEAESEAPEPEDGSAGGLR